MWTWNDRNTTRANVNDRLRESNYIYRNSNGKFVKVILRFNLPSFFADHVDDSRPFLISGASSNIACSTYFPAVFSAVQHLFSIFLRAALAVRSHETFPAPTTQRGPKSDRTKATTARMDSEFRFRKRPRACGRAHFHAETDRIRSEVIRRCVLRAAASSRLRSRRCL